MAADGGEITNRFYLASDSRRLGNSYRSPPCKAVGISCSPPHSDGPRPVIARWRKGIKRKKAILNANAGLASIQFELKEILAVEVGLIEIALTRLRRVGALATPTL